MNRYFISKYFAVLLLGLLGACQTIPEWGKDIAANPVENGRCPDISGRFNYEYPEANLGIRDPSERSRLLEDDLPDNLPADHVVPTDFKPGITNSGSEQISNPPPAPGFYAGHYGSSAIFNKIFMNRLAQKRMYSPPGEIVVTLTRLDQLGRKYHVRVDRETEGLLGEYDFKFDDTWVCSGNKFVRSVKSSLYERPDRDEAASNDYRRVYVLQNGNIQIERKHTDLYQSRTFAKIP
jgi:hypothetical protein